MRICLVSQEYPNETDFGGIATYNYYLSKGLIKYNINVIVICRSYIKNSYHIDKNGIEIYRIYCNDDTEYRKKISQLILKLNKYKTIDLIESPEWKADLYDFISNNKYETNIPIVIKLHTPYFVWKKYNDINQTNNDIEKIERETICLSDGLSSCSNSLKSIIVNEYNIKPSKITVIPNMIDVDKNSDNNIVRTKNSIYYIGSLEQRKGVFLLAESFKLIKKLIPSASLYFIGRDTKRNSKNISTKYCIETILDGLSDYYFIEHVPNQEITNYMKTAHVIVYPSLYENFPYVILEAMLNGCAIIGSDNGGVPEMIKNNISGLLYSPPSVESLTEKLLKVLLNNNTTNNLRHNALKEVEKFSIDNIIPLQIKYYNEIIQKIKKY